MSMLLSLNLFVLLRPLRSLSQGEGPARGGRGGGRGGPFLGKAKWRAGPNQEGGRAREGAAGVVSSVRVAVTVTEKYGRQGQGQRHRSQIADVPRGRGRMQYPLAGDGARAAVRAGAGAIRSAHGAAAAEDRDIDAGYALR